MSWTQPMCDLCWVKQRGLSAQPARTAPEFTELERCAWCGASTRSGIYVRVDPATVPFPRADT